MDLRAIERIAWTDRFDRAIKQASDSEITTLEESYDPEVWRDWIAEKLKESLEDKSFNDLKRLAKNHNIPRYSRLRRDELLEALRATGMV